MVTTFLRGRIDINSVTGGVLTLNGDDVLTLDPLSRSDLDNLIFTPTLNSTAQGEIKFIATESNGATDGTIYTLNVNVTPVNDLPTAENNEVTTTEDIPLELGQDDFGFMDVEDGDDVSQGRINISSVAGGVLTLDGDDVLTLDPLSRSDLDNLIFTPTLNSTAQGEIKFIATESNGATDGTVYTLNVNVEEQNDLPTAQNKTLITTEDKSVDLRQADFEFNDVEDGDDVSQGSINIESVSGGTLTLYGLDVLTPAELTRTDLDNLTFTPTLNSFADGEINFQAIDSDDATDGTTYTLTIEVTSVNDVPTAASNTISTDEDTPRTLSQSDFGFTDVEDQADLNLGTITISSVTGGRLQLNGSDLDLTSSLSRSELDNLEFIPTENSNTAGTIEFEVTDSDGATSETTHTLTINVTPVNDVPTAQNNTISTDEDTPRSLTQADFEFTDIEDQTNVENGTISISAVTGGTIELNGSSVSLPASLSRSDLDNLIFIPTANSSDPGLIQFEAIDSDEATDGTSYTLTINVTAVNDAPTLVVPTLDPVLENTVYVADPVGSDAEDGFARWAIVGGADAASFVNEGGRLRFVDAPDFEKSTAQDGSNEYRVLVAAVDSDDLQSAEQLLTIQVADVNEAPLALTDRVNADVQVFGDRSSVSVNLNDLVTDADAGDLLTFTIQNQADPGLVTIGDAGNVFFDAANLRDGGTNSFQFVGTDSERPAVRSRYR